MEKDIENGEIKYKTRSKLQNIPWVNKIYIIMPNKKVKYFKFYLLRLIFSLFFIYF